MIVVLMGVSGAGKTTIGRLLAARLGAAFIEGDDYHPPANVAKMASGMALTDDDRWPWLEELNRILRTQANAVLACSALKAAYRDRLLAGVEDARLVHLHGDKALIAARLAERRHRYMPASLLDSQFSILEPPREAIVVDVSRDAQSCADDIARALNPGGQVLN